MPAARGHDYNSCATVENFTVREQKYPYFRDSERYTLIFKLSILIKLNVNSGLLSRDF